MIYLSRLCVQKKKKKAEVPHILKQNPGFN